MGDEKATRKKLFLFPGQARLLRDATKLNHVYFGGVGHGKTRFGPRWQHVRNVANRKSFGKKSAVIAPTYKLLKRHHIPYYKHALREFGYLENKHYTVNLADMVIEYKCFDYSVHFASADNYKSIVAWEFDSIWWDEPGFASVEVKEFVDQRTGRSKGSKVGQVLFTGVVQIANWYYEQFGPNPELTTTESYTLPKWVEEYAPGWGGKELVRYRENKNTLIMHASTFENPTLVPSYFIRQYDAYGYDKNKFGAHVVGLALAVNTNAVYDMFDDAASIGDYPVDFEGPTPHLNLCFDFNYGQMSLLVVQEYGGGYFVVWENGSSAKTTEDACRQFIKAFPPKKFKNRALFIYGDSAGYARNPQIKTRDGSYQIIKQLLSRKYTHVKVKAPRFTVPQEIRVMATNKFHGMAKSDGSTVGLYCDRACRKLITGWKTVSWDARTGKIKKGSGDTITHAPEAVDYFMYRAEPPTTSKGSAWA